MADVAQTTISDPGLTSRPPVVMQVVPSLETGGVERGTVDMAVTLAEEGWRSLVVSSGGAMVHEILRAGGEHFELPVHSKNPMVMRANTERLVSLIREHDVDVVHARSRAPAWSARRAARNTGAHFVTTFHAPYNLGLPLKRLYNSVMADGDRVIAISAFIARHAVETYRAEPERIRVIHRGIDIDRFDPARVSAERVIKLSTDWRLADGAPVVMLPGRLTRWKGQIVLIEAMAKLGRDDLRCLIVGGDQGRVGYRRELEALIAKRGLESVVHLVGDCTDIPAALMLADAVVSASTDPEAFGRVIVEAQAMGRPIVAADHGASRELVLPDETGWLVPPNDPDALAAALQTALALNATERESMAVRSIKRVQEQFTKQAMCSATMDVYRELLTEAQADGDVAA
jgi:glycosyltransferase involved in cell wall biosynthesis